VCDSKRLDEAEESLNATLLPDILAHVDDSRAKLVREHMQGL
jgi:hypothetical protein